MKIYIWNYASYGQWGGGLILASGKSLEEAREKLRAKFPDKWWLDKIDREPDRTCAPSQLAEGDGWVE